MILTDHWGLLHLHMSKAMQHRLHITVLKQQGKGDLLANDEVGADFLGASFAGAWDLKSCELAKKPGESGLEDAAFFGAALAGL